MRESLTMSEFDRENSETISLTSNEVLSSSSSSTEGNILYFNPEKRRKLRLSSTELEADSTAKNKKESLILEYSIDPYEYDDNFLIEMSLEMFHYYELPEFYKFTNETLIAFMHEVRNLYHPGNNFHNFKHAWGVMHMSFQLLVHGVDKCLSSFDILGILIAAVCHDVGHPGNNNAFEMATKSDVSKQYSIANESCGLLERYHSGLTRKLLFRSPSEAKNDSSSVTLLDGLKDEEREKLFELVNFIILGTDMAKHGCLVEEAQNLVKQSKQLLMSSVTSTDSDSGSSESKKTTDSQVAKQLGRSDLQMTPKSGKKHFIQEAAASPTAVADCAGVEQLFSDEKAREKLARILVHTADIGAQTQEYSIAEKWVNRCYTEFQSQANKEKQLGIITSPFLHELTDDKKIFASQYSFITDIVEPLWTAFTELFPDLQFASGQLVSNKTSYKKYF